MTEITWPHAPLHRLSEAGTYFVTCATLYKKHYFRSPQRLDVLQRGLLNLAFKYDWQLEAWCIFSNHYHFVGHSPANGAGNLGVMLKEFHAKTAQWINKLDNVSGRRVWYNYRETQLTYLNSYLARLNYVHQNPVKHGLVSDASDYPWGSAEWLSRNANYTQINKLASFDWRKVNVNDDYDPVHPFEQGTSF